jgi:hypothetical protein
MFILELCAKLNIFNLITKFFFKKNGALIAPFIILFYFLGAIDEYKKYNCPAGDCNEVCYRKDFDGCHVQKANNIFDRKWYIVPLCSECNQSVGTFDIGNVNMIPTPNNL